MNGPGQSLPSRTITSLKGTSSLLLLVVLVAILCSDNAAAKDFKTRNGAASRSLQSSSGAAAGDSSPGALQVSAGSEVTDKRLIRKRSKIAHKTPWVSNDGSLVKKIVAQVVAERDAQIAAALFEVAKNQPHLQMMVQTLGELSQTTQRLEISFGRLDDSQRRLDSRLGVISEKISLLENRLGQGERRMEREMTQVQAKLEDFLRVVNMADRPSDSSLPMLKEIQDQLVSIEELLLDNQPTNKLKRRSRVPLRSRSIERAGNKFTQSLSSVHGDLVRILREVETNLEHQISMLSSDNGVFSCAISRLLDWNSSNSSTREPLNENLLTFNGSTTENYNNTKCILRCP